MEWPDLQKNNFYEPTTVNDSGRRCYHDSIVTKELSGQKGFSWGAILNFFSAEEGFDHLPVIYTLGSHVALHPNLKLLKSKQAKRFG